MPLEVIENITQVEAENRERKTAAEAKAKQIIADAQRDGLALLQQTREEAAARRRPEQRPKGTRSAGPPRRRERPCAGRRRAGWTRPPISSSEGL